LHVALKPSGDKHRVPLEAIDVLGVQPPQDALGLQDAEEPVGGRGGRRGGHQLPHHLEERPLREGTDRSHVRRGWGRRGLFFEHAPVRISVDGDGGNGIGGVAKKIEHLQILT